MSVVKFLRGPTIKLSSGPYFDYEAPEACQFTIDDVAHALSNICLFTGHCTDFYSVAQRSVLLSHMVDHELAFVALMHAATTAFVGNMDKPLKALLPDFNAARARVKRAVSARFGLPIALPEAIEAAKSALLAIEQRDVHLACGRHFDYINPRASRFDIHDIANALSNICRFVGHTNEFYSVAQHSVLVSYAVPPQYALEGLMHDAPEAFVGDVAKPLKILLPDYARVESRVEADIFERFGLPVTLNPSVKTADLILLRTEQRDIMGADDEDWLLTEGAPPLSARITPLEPKAARSVFIERFEELCGPAPSREAAPMPAGYAQCNVDRIVPMAPRQAKQAFLQRFHELAQGASAARTAAAW